LPIPKGPPSSLVQLRTADQPTMLVTQDPMRTWGVAKNPNGASTGGFPAMAGNVTCGSFAAPHYFLKPDTLRVSLSARHARHREMTLEVCARNGDSDGTAGCSGCRAHSPDTNSRRITLSVRSDLICDRDSGQLMLCTHPRSTHGPLRILFRDAILAYFAVACLNS
jgi:hypothetical protein